MPDSGLLYCNEQQSNKPKSIDFDKRESTKLRIGFSEARKSKTIETRQKTSSKTCPEAQQKRNWVPSRTAPHWCNPLAHFVRVLSSWYSPVQQTGKYFFQLDQTGITSALTHLRNTCRDGSFEKSILFRISRMTSDYGHVSTIPPSKKRATNHGTQLAPNPRRP